MKINITYPHVEKIKETRQIKVLNICRIILLLIAIICPIINIIVGGKPWSLMVLLVLHACYGHWFYY